MDHTIVTGIMQGRLSDKPGQPLQSFPWKSWREEFSRASFFGLNQIEWLVDGYNDTMNPLASYQGRKEIKDLSLQYNISVNSVCAHKFIDGALLGEDESAKTTKLALSQLLLWASEAEIKFVILPIMGAMSIQNPKAKNKLRKILHEIVTIHSPTILLESDLPAIDLKEFIDETNLDNVRVLYDLGNASAMNFDITKELNILHSMIGEIHIKDRFINDGGSDRLGEADTPLNSAAKTLSELSWRGPVILETPVFDDWNAEAESNISYTERWVDLILNSEKS